MGEMVRIWLAGFGLLLAMGVAACSQSSSDSGVNVQIVAGDDNDPETWDISDQFMIGTKLLVAPVTEDGARSRSVYFPAGSWYDVWTGNPVQGGQRLTVNAPIGSPPVYARDQDRDDLRNWQTLTYADCR